MGMTARLGLKEAYNRLIDQAREVEMGMTARLGLKVRDMCPCSIVCCSRNGDDSPIGIESKMVLGMTDAIP